MILAWVSKMVPQPHTDGEELFWTITSGLAVSCKKGWGEATDRILLVLRCFELLRKPVCPCSQLVVRRRTQLTNTNKSARPVLLSFCLFILTRSQTLQTFVSQTAEPGSGPFPDCGTYACRRPRSKSSSCSALRETAEPSCDQADSGD